MILACQIEAVLPNQDAESGFALHTIEIGRHLVERDELVHEYSHELRGFNLPISVQKRNYLGRGHFLRNSNAIQLPCRCRIDFYKVAMQTKRTPLHIEWEAWKEF